MGMFSFLQFFNNWDLGIHIDYKLLIEKRYPNSYIRLLLYWFSRIWTLYVVLCSYLMETAGWKSLLKSCWQILLSCEETKTYGCTADVGIKAPSQSLKIFMCFSLILMVRKSPKKYFCFLSFGRNCHITKNF